MDDYISRQAAIDALCALYEYQRSIDPTEAADLVRQGIFLAEKKIEKLPSAQPEIIRCKDCKHYTEPNIEYCELYGAMILWGKDDFCSRGERRTDE